jgi:hypothetical protein
MKKKKLMKFEKYNNLKETKKIVWNKENASIKFIVMTSYLYSDFFKKDFTYFTHDMV